MAQAIKCSHCGAPLPDSKASTINCPFCGVTNRIHPTVGQTQVREAVRQILNERVQKQPQVTRKSNQLPVIALIAGAVVMLGLAGALSAMLTRPYVPPPVPRVVTPRTPTTPVPPKPSEPPAPPPKQPWGQLYSLVADEQGALLAVFGSNLVKIDAQTLEATWVTAFKRGSGNYAIIIPRGKNIAVVTDSVASFFDSASGELTNDYQYKNGGILERACAAGPTQLLVDVLGDGVMRFDAATGKKAEWGPSCALKDKLACPAGQRCGWSRMQNSEYDCNYAVHVGKDVFRSCTTEDGKKRRVITASGARAWEHETEEVVEAYFGVVGDVLIVGGYRNVVAFDKNTGEELWRKPGSASTVFAGKDAIYFETEGTLVAVNPLDGSELRRLALRD
ncbi:MAG: PQQ-binding-like beta-propeller repeat protein [Archangium sp.]